ncbi:hypothetical protein B0A48_17171 [Cryoendolithus antarcticus]|uniref:Uncharacterized protein n=1 Tax=Cryoendolithus antarcticus TaxID=1507870 RepID=A0A1V8SCJ9_9PEZI|nr:hypothetical protein B0A48_17171 [Cryoendolithus antarcticus]
MDQQHDGNAGDYVAQGIGLSSAIETVSLTTQQSLAVDNTTTLQPSASVANLTTGAFNTTSLALSTTVPKQLPPIVTGGTAIPLDYSNSTVGATIAASTLASNITVSTALVANKTTSAVYANATAPVDVCWNQWLSYWDVVGTNTVDIPASTTTYTWTENVVTQQSTTELFTSTVVNGPFTQTIFTTLVTTIIAVSIPTFTGTSTDTYTARPVLTTPPPCALPSSVGQCQASWEAWAVDQYSVTLPPVSSPEGCDLYASPIPDSCVGPVSTYNSQWQSWFTESVSVPPCTQASISGSMCYGLRTKFLQEQQLVGEQSGVAGGVEVWTTVNGTASDYFSWPSTSLLAPGCTVGCGIESCKIQAGTVQLLYWPPNTEVHVSRGNHTIVPANATGPVTAVALGRTFTSPTVYISFDSLYARDSCAPYGPTYTDQIVALTNPADLSSLWGSSSGGGVLSTAFFNYTDIYITPVPESIYTSQPRCASARASACDPRKGNEPDMSACLTWTCPRVAPYEPIIAIPPEVKNLDPAWASCGGGINGAYDPPLPLTPVSTVVGVTTPGDGGLDTTTPATPASTPQSPAAPVTTGAGTTTPAPDNLPASSTSPSTIQSTAEPPIAKPSSSQLADTQPANIDPGTSDPGNSDPGSSDPSGSDPGHGSTGNDQPGSSPQAGAQPGASSSPQATQLPAPSNSPATTNALSVLDSVLSSAQHAASSSPPGGNAETGGNAGSNGGNVGGSTGNGQADVSSSGPDSAPPVVVAVPNGGSATVSQVGGGSVAIANGGSVTVVAAGAAATIGGQTFSVPSSGGAVVIGSSTQVLPAAAAQTPTTIVAGGQTLTASNAGSGVIVAQGGSTVTVVPGQAATLGSQVVSLATNNGGLVVGSSTFAVVATTNPASVGSAPASAVITANGQTITAVAQGGSVVLSNDGTAVTVSAGAAATIAGQVISAPQIGGAVMVGDSTVQLSTSQAVASQGIFTAGGQTVTAVAQGGSVVLESDGPATIVPANGVATIGGQVVSVQGTGSAVVIGGSTLSLSAGPTKVFTAGGQAITAVDLGTAVVLQVSGQSITLAAGGIGIIAGQAAILDASRDVVVDGTTVHVNPATVSAGTAVFTQDGHTITAIRQGNSVVLQEGGKVTTVPADATVAFAGEVITDPGARITAAPAALTTILDDGQTLTALDTGGSIVLIEDGSTVTIAKGQQTVFRGETISALSTGAALVVNGSQPLSLTSSPAAGTAFATLVHDGRTLTALDAGPSVVLVENGTTITLAKGQQTVFDGETISAMPTGGAVVLDGATTLSLTSGAPTTTESGVDAGSGGSSAEATGSGTRKGDAGWYGLVLCVAIGAFVL